MNSILLTVLLVGTIGLIGSVVLVVASKKLAVKEDERLASILEILPGANCGSCGYPGCEGYAKAMLDGAAVNSCGPGGPGGGPLPGPSGGSIRGSRWRSRRKRRCFRAWGSSFLLYSLSQRTARSRARAKASSPA